MEQIKLKLQEFKKKCRKFWLITKRKAKAWFIKFERKLGYATRCSLCEDNIFCETYQGSRKRLFHVERCTDHVSTR